MSEYSFEPARFDEMRRGAWDIEARIKDMDINGVYASLNFPSFLPGFAGQRLQLTTKDTELALATVRAWNDWHIEEWAGTDPTRIIPCQIPWLLDPELGAEEIRRNAERGFKAVTFSEGPQVLGLPSLHTGHWDPIMRACAETETVVNLHIGSSGASPATAADAPPDTVGVLFFGYAMFAAVDWLYSLIPVRFPDIKICMSEGGIGWVAGSDGPTRPHAELPRHVRHVDPGHRPHARRRCCGATSGSVRWRTRRPSSSASASASTTSSSRPTTRTATRPGRTPRPRSSREIGGLPAEDIRKFTWENASRLYRHPVPAGGAGRSRRLLMAVRVALLDDYQQVALEHGRLVGDP